MLWTWWIGLGSLLAGLAVAFGAFGAHALKSRMTPEYLAVFETAVRYHMYHALALIAVGLVAVRIESTPLKWAGSLFFAGILLFSGSLYALTITGNRALGMITPAGGAALILGWCLLAFAVLRPG